MASQTVWSVDIGKSSLKAVRLRRDRNNIEILAVDKVDYPMSKNGVDAATQAKEALGVFRARNEVRDPVAVLHPGQGTFQRFIKVPASDEKKVDAMVGYEASQQIPFPLDEVIWDYHVIDREYLPGEEREVALFAVRREAIDDFLLDFANENLVVDVVTIGYVGLLNFVRHDINPEEPAIVLDIGASHTDLVLVDGSRFWIRPIPHSGSDITRAIMKRFKLGYAEAEKLKLDASKAPKQAVKIFQAVIQPKLKELVGEIHRSIGYYRSQAGEVNFKLLYLLGNGSKIIGIKKFLEEQLGVRVTRVQSINHFRVNRGVNLRLLQAHLPSFATTLGAGLQALGVGACHVDLVPKEEKIKKELGRKKKHAFIAAAVVAVLMFLANSMINSKLEEIQPEYEAAKELAADIKKYEGLIAEEKSGGEGRDAILRKAKILGEIAEVRPLVLQGLQTLEEVLAPFRNANARRAEVAEVEGSTEETDKVRATYLKQLEESLWVPWLEVELVQFPHTKDGKPRAGQLTVPAYWFRAIAVIKARPERAEADKFIEEKLAEPLATAIRARQISRVADVMLDPGQDLNAIYYNGVQAAVRIEDGQEGGPFYGARLSWYLVPRDPPEPEKVADTSAGKK
ncbi:MAG: type IV pilus assembly protein PilM [Planctomycetota bacterium]|nr:type IV pilus assembly protein PilM [Planctomycetota bacterium]